MGNVKINSAGLVVVSSAGLVALSSGTTTKIATAAGTSVTDNGVTFNFDQSIERGQFVDGSWFVLSTATFDIDSITPASAITNGGWAHGAGKDVFIGDTAAQPFDEFLNTGTGSMTFSGNVDPGQTLSSITIAQDEETTITKSERLASVITDTPKSWQTMEKYVHLTVLSEAPRAGTFRPTATGTTKRLYGTYDLDLTVFRSLSFPAAWTDSPATLLASLPLDPGNFGNNNGEQWRRLRLDNAQGYASTNYSNQVAPEYGKACAVMHNSAYTDAQKQDLLYRLIVWGIQMEGADDRGFIGQGGIARSAGQGAGWGGYYYLTAFALQSASMLAKVQSILTPADCCYWILDATKSVEPDGADDPSFGSGFFDEHIGVPFTSSSRDVGPHIGSRYGDIATHGNFWDLTGAFMLQNGPASETGFSARNNGAYGTANKESAVWASFDRAVTIDPWPSASYVPNALIKELWDTTARNLSLYTPWTGVPASVYPTDVTGFDGTDGEPFTGTATGYSWDLSAVDYATETKTGREFGYSLDGTQFVAVSTSDNSSITGLLPGVKHYLYFKWQSASGWGAQVPNYQLNTDNLPVEPNAVSTTGSGTPATPAFTTNPVIHVKKNVAWGDHPGNWKAVSGTFDKDDIELKAGMGYINGDAAPSGFAYQWERDGGDIGGATSQLYTRVAADAGTDLTCAVTPSNSSGAGTEVTTAAVTCPAITTLATATLITTDFRGGFAVDYESELGTLTSSVNCTESHEPGGLPVVLDALNFGCIFGDKTGSNPSFEFDINKAASTTTTYDLTGQFIIINADDTKNYYLEIIDSGGVIHTETLAGATDLEAEKTMYSPAQLPVDWGYKDISMPFTTGANTALTVKLRAANSTGGGSGGDLFLTQLTISEQ